MRKIGMVLVALATLGGAALAASEQTPRLETHRLNRWGFDARGPTESEVAYRHCQGDRLITVNTRHTGTDWLAAILSAGWYTPGHVTIQCAPR